MVEVRRDSLLRTAIIEVDSVGSYVECRVINRPEVGPEEGAEGAQLLEALLTGHVFVPGSRWRGVLFDVRLGPPVFGPKTREALASMFAGAERFHVSLAIVVNHEHAIQRLQFISVCKEAAPTTSCVVDDEDSAWGWLKDRS